MHKWYHDHGYCDVSDKYSFDATYTMSLSRNEVTARKLGSLPFDYHLLAHADDSYCIVGTGHVFTCDQKSININVADVDGIFRARQNHKLTFVMKEVEVPGESSSADYKTFTIQHKDSGKYCATPDDGSQPMTCLSDTVGEAERIRVSCATQLARQSG